MIGCLVYKVFVSLKLRENLVNLRSGGRHRKRTRHHRGSSDLTSFQRLQHRVRPFSESETKVSKGAALQRKTQQRERIVSVLKDAARPLTIHELLERASVGLSSLGIATVYRCVKTLMDSGDVKLVEIAGEPLRYESADLAHHHHFVCDKCKKVFDVEGCVSLASLAPAGFRIREHEIVLYGTCASCG